jgi:hypothetical protein
MDSREARVSGSRSRAAHTQRVRCAVDVVEPRRDKCDLQNRCIIEPRGAQLFVMTRSYLCSILREFHDVLAHDALGISNGCCLEIAAQHFHQAILQGYATQKLCV